MCLNALAKQRTNGEIGKREACISSVGYIFRFACRHEAKMGETVSEAHLGEDTAMTSNVMYVHRNGLCALSQYF
jgi:hypothetical protein